MARDLNDTLIFVKVVEHGSFISAARALRLPKTTVSRKVQDLETRLGAQLLHRTTRKLGLTEAGNVYFEHCQRIARELDEAESAVGPVAGRSARLAAHHRALFDGHRPGSRRCSANSTRAIPKCAWRWCSTTSRST